MRAWTNCVQASDHAPNSGASATELASHTCHVHVHHAIGVRPAPFLLLDSSLSYVPSIRSLHRKHRDHGANYILRISSTAEEFGSLALRGRFNLMTSKSNIHVTCFPPNGYPKGISWPLCSRSRHALLGNGIINGPSYIEVVQCRLEPAHPPSLSHTSGWSLSAL